MPALPDTVVVLFDGFDDLDAVAPVEILTAAGFPVRVLGAPGTRGRIRSAHGLDISVDPLEPEPPGLAVLPGGGWLHGTGVREQCRGPLPALLASWYAAGTVIGSVCTGAMLLAAA
ncbi:MAG: DJ-1/PfpI family protein, partial [Solirubrobacteraceae bacterium]